MPSGVDESNPEGLSPRDLACDLARRKITVITERFKGTNPVWIFGADTLISLDGQVIGKSLDREQARTTLRAFSGREHEVITGMALYSGQRSSITCRAVTSIVRFAALSERKLEWYLETGEWQGAAGAYKIQGLGACLVEELRGSYSGVVGLPLHEFYDMLISAGYAYGEEEIPAPATR